MANPTTNYGWVLPTPTDLVTDLPADFDVALQGVDTTTKALNPSTTLGDLEYRSATANTNTRLGIGSTGNVLTVAGGVPTWAAPAAGGGYTLISTTALTSGTTVTLGSIPSTYKHLYLTWTGLYGSDGDSLAIRFNSDTGNNYDSFVFGASTTNTFFTALGNNDPKIDLPNALTTDSTDRAGGTLFVTNYLDTTAYGKLFNGFYYVRTPTPTNRAATIIGAYNGTSAISSITFQTGGVDTFTNGELKLYGVN
jgi:hypothetical protein